MCAIIDSNVRDELVKKRPSAIGKYFRDRISGPKRSLKLVVGGKLLRELGGSEQVKRWIIEGIRSGYVMACNDQEVDKVAEDIVDQCHSNDPHIIALAQVSGARLLFTRDHKLMADFCNRELLGGHVPGRVYTDASGRRTLGRHHKELLARTDLCDVPHK